MHNLVYSTDRRRMDGKPSVLLLVSRPFEREPLRAAHGLPPPKAITRIRCMSRLTCVSALCTAGCRIASWSILSAVTAKLLFLRLVWLFLWPLFPSFLPFLLLGLLSLRVACSGSRFGRYPVLSNRTDMRGRHAQHAFMGRAKKGYCSERFTEGRVQVDWCAPNPP